MKLIGQSKSFLFAAVFLVALILVGCGASNTPPATNTSAPTQNAVSVAATPTAETANGSASATQDDDNDEDVTAEATVENTAETTASASSVETAACTKLNLNTLTEDQLMSTIPNFSSRMVREFFEYRPYDSIQQFRREIGKYVDDAQVAEYEQYVFVPVDPNNADADTLKQIPGVDDALASSLTAGRPYASNQAFLDALGKSLDAQQLTEATCYVMASA